MNFELDYKFSTRVLSLHGKGLVAGGLKGWPL